MEKDFGAPSLNGDSRFHKPSLNRSGSAPVSKFTNISRVHCGGSDMNRRKKVKFADSATVHELSCKRDASSLPAKGAHADNVYEAKTSEYKSLRKLREETGKKFHYHLPKHEINLKTFEPSDSIAELNNSIRDKYNVSTSFLPVQNVTSIAKRPSLSPTEVSQNSELNKMITFRDDMSRCLSPIQKVTPIARGSSLSLAKVSQNCGPKYEYDGIFTKKRENMLKLAAETLSVEINDFILNRSDLISGLLERLGTGIKSSDPDEIPKAEQDKSKSVDNLLASSKSDGYLEELHETARTDFSKTTTKKYLGKDCVGAQASPTWHALGTGLQFERMKFKWLLDGGRISDLHSENKSASAIEWNTDFGNSCRFDTMDLMVSESDYPSPINFPSRCHFTKKSLVPFVKIEQERSNGVDHLLASSESDGYLEELHETSRTDFSEIIAKRHLDKDLLPYRCSEADDLIPSKKDFVEAQAFPAWNDLGTGIQSRRKYKWILDDERISDLHENKSSSGIDWNTDYGYHTMDRMLLKSNYLIPNMDQSLAYFLKSEPEKSNGFGHLLASSKYGYLEGLWGTSGTDYSETTARKHLGKDSLSYRYSDADDLISSSTDDFEAQAFPTSHAPRTGLDCKRKYKWISDDEKIAELPGENESASDFERNVDSYHMMDLMPSKSDYFIPGNFPSKNHFTEQSVGHLPLLNSLELCDSRTTDLFLQPAVEQCTIRLLGWDQKFEKEPESSVGHLPLTSSTALDLFDRTKDGWYIDGYERRNTFVATRYISPSPRWSPFNTELEWKSLPNQSEENMKAILCRISAENKDDNCEVEPTWNSKINFQVACRLADFRPSASNFL